MQPFTFKQSFTSLPSMQPAYDLAKRCEEADGFPTKVYWHALAERGNDTNAFDYLCFAEDNLVGMLNILFFAESVEISILVDPAYRKQGLAKKLLHIALVKLRGYIVTFYTFICNQKAKTLIEKHIAQGAVKDHYETEMLAPTNIPPLKKQKVHLQRAENADIPVLAEIHELCFKQPNAEAMEKRFAVTILETNRKIYIARNNQSDIVGKIHVREDHNRIYLHDVGIYPAFQQQGYGYALMIEWLTQFAKDYSKPIIVEVLDYNTTALQLYKNCGFEVININEFWKFPFKN